MDSVEAMKAATKMNFYGQISHASFLKASDWYHKAAQKGERDCMYMAGICDLFRKDPEHFRKRKIENLGKWE